MRTPTGQPPRVSACDSACPRACGSQQVPALGQLQPRPTIAALMPTANGSRPRPIGGAELTGWWVARSSPRRPRGGVPDTDALREGPPAAGLDAAHQEHPTSGRGPLDRPRAKTPPRSETKSAVRSTDSVGGPPLPPVIPAPAVDRPRHRSAFRASARTNPRHRGTALNAPLCGGQRLPDQENPQRQPLRKDAR